MKGLFWGSTQCGAKGMGPTLVLGGNNSLWVSPLSPRLAGGLLPYAPTYSSWLDCWSQLHREVSGQSQAVPGCRLAMEKSWVEAPVGFGVATAGLGAALTHLSVAVSSLPGQHEPREQPVFPQGAHREAIRVGGEEVSLKPEW